MDQTIKKVEKTLSRYGMIRSGDRVVVAVSGGPDSVCLLDVLHELRNDLGISVLVAHLDHGLRPDEDEAETQFVKTLAGSLGLPFETKKVFSGIETGRGPLEERARRARYTFFEEVRKKFSAQKIAVGHNLNDQAETVLMRLIRGSGLSGLTGIPPVREGRIIRPLIEITRDEILAYLERKNLEYMTDPSNLEPRFMRNRIRLDLIPRIQEIQPRIVEILGQTAELARREDEWMAAACENWVKQTAETEPDKEARMPLSSFTKLSEALRSRIIRYAIKKTGGSLRRIGMRHIEAVDRLAMAHRPQARINLPNGLIAKRRYDKLVFSRYPESRSEEFSYVLESPGTFHLEKLGCTVTLEEIHASDLPMVYDSPWTAYLNGDRMGYPLMIRNFRPGDKFVPFGMSGHKKLKAFFIDLKIPAEARIRVPILTHNDVPVWVCGHRIDDRFKVMPDVEKILKVTIHPTRP